MWRNAANAVGFQLVWASCVLGAAQGVAWVGATAALVFAALVLCFGGKPRDDLVALLLTLPLGMALDSSFSVFGWLDYARADANGLAPAWIAALWMGFAFTLNHSLAFLRDRIWLAVLLGLICAPLSYLAAQRFGAVQFVAASHAALPMLAVAWALLLPLLFGLLRFTSSAPRHDGHPA